MPDKKQPVHAVVGVICDALSDLSPEEQLRALKAAAESLGVDLMPPLRTVTLPGNDRPQGVPIDPPWYQRGASGTGTPAPPQLEVTGRQPVTDPAYDTGRACNPWPRGFGGTFA